MFNKEQLEALVITLKENISLAESLLKTGKYEDVEAVKSMITSQQKTLEDYTERLENIKVGRPPIGITKKVSLTLSEENWKLFDEQADGNRSKFLREIVGEKLVYENDEPVSVKPTFISCCAECNKDFREGETCYFTWYENNVFCHDCKEIMNGRVTESYLEWQLRIHAK